LGAHALSHSAWLVVPLTQEIVAEGLYVLLGAITCVGGLAH
jgi:hypothetical protein